MTTIEKAKDLFWCEECDSMISESHRCEQWSHVARIPAKAVIAIKSLAALEAEKPAEDAMEVALKVLKMEPNRNSTIDYANVIQQYAEAYHTKQCEECKNDSAKRANSQDL